MQATCEIPPRIPRQYKRTNNSLLNIPSFPLESNENGEGGESKNGSPVKDLAQISGAQTQQLLSQQISTSSTTTTSSSSRVAKSSQKIMSASTLKANLSELKSSISEMKSLSSFNSMKSSVEDLVEECESDVCTSPCDGEPLVTFPDQESPPESVRAMSPEAMCLGQKRNKKVLSERSVANSFGLKRMQSGEVTFQETQAQQKVLAKLEMDGVTAEKSVNKLQEQRSIKSGEVTQRESQSRSAATLRLQSGTFTTEKNMMAAQQQSQTITSTGLVNQEKHTSHQNYIFTKGMSSKTSVISSQMVNSSHLLNGQSNLKMIEEDPFPICLDELEKLSSNSTTQEVENAKAKYSDQLYAAVKTVKSLKGENCKKIPLVLNRINEMIRKAWEVPTHGHDIGSTLCNSLRASGGLDFLLTNNTDDEQQFASAKLLEQCLTSENRDYVVSNGLEMVVTSACVCTKNSNSIEHSRVGTGILEHLFKHSEGTCSDVIRLGGLDSVLFECRKNDVETLRHCAGALANLSLYGGAENHEAMIKRKVPMWLFPLAFHTDDNIKYYACLAIVALVANKEIEAAVLKSGTLDLVEPFITTHNPSEFAKSNQAHAHGQSKHWLQRLVPVLSSKREEARNLAAFHFCMEAWIKKQQGNTELFKNIGAIEPLKKVASCPNAIASKFAAQALRLIGEEIPHKLSQQVPLWSTEDVREWVKQIGFAEYALNFTDSRVDGDLLLQLTEDNLMSDIGITNGIRRKRFTRELQTLKKMADYSSRDSSNLNSFLQSIGPEFSVYTYAMLNAGVDKETLRSLSEEQLVSECGITNSIHRYRMLDLIRANENNIGTSFEENLDKSLDVFISYRRSNGSQLASLLKVHLQLRGFSVFIDVERLEAGKFDNNLLHSIRQAKHFILVLTSSALDRCIADDDCKDWVHREIVAALQAQCNIIPIMDNFSWPDPEKLPDDMRAVCHFNGVMWIHDYQDACVDKLERFMRGDPISRSITGTSRTGDMTPGTPSISHKPPFNRNHSNMSADGSEGSRE
ncbi:sterile alpha and TIR motif-containing protein 1 isoform X2 [Cimex lectularius]|uniref:ADP-ribosyl cyclase/cyclic ADP-ribose hydrolase n=1 Tax=Cimex lectularius TaxID=79782 RepID=A0A8I6RHK1_CIMLE|nr:sterile alpha and TIR motif-containing protein 1 isoform X2 [Cimex lectularius]